MKKDLSTEKYIEYLEYCISIYARKEKQHLNDSIEYMKLYEKYSELKDLLVKLKPYLYYFINNNKHVGFTPDAANLLERIDEIQQRKEHSSDE